MKADDGFAGAGGWDLAARELGIEARGIENMKEARATRDAAGLVTIHDDVWTFVPDGQAVGKIDSPPCQTFSAAGRGAGRKALEDVLRGIRDGYYRDLDHLRFLGLEVGDERTALVLTPLHFATQHDYEWLAWEQVPTVLPVWEACAEVLRAQGWHVWAGLLHAEQYGVPQTRKRAFLLASRRHAVTPPTPTHSRYYSRTPDKLDEGVAKWVSMAEGIGWGLVRRPSFTVCGVSSHAVGDSEWGGASVRKALRDAADSGDPELWRELVMVSNYGTGGDASKRGERRLSEPAPTITSKVDRNLITVADVANRNRAGNVRITVDEAGILQSFPTAYPWQGSKSYQYLQAGNAVPPGLALHALAAAAGIDAREVSAA